MDYGVFRNWFAYNVPVLDSPLVSAQLSLPNPNRYGNGSFTYTIYGMTSKPQKFSDINAATLPVWGVATTTPSSKGGTVIVNFNATGLEAIKNYQGNTIYIGGIDSGETLGGYNGDFSNTGEYDTGVDMVVHSLLVLNTSSTASVDSTCSAVPSGFSSFQFEHPVSFAGVLSTLQMNIPFSVAVPIFSGQAWIRERLTYDNTSKILVTDLYTVPVGTPFPTPATIDITGTRFGYLISSISNVLMSCSPRPSVLMSGVALDGANLYGLPVGSGYALGFGWTTDATPVIHDIATISAGIAVSFDTHAWGTLQLLPPAATTGTSSLGYGLASISISGAPVITTSSRSLTLSATAAGAGPYAYAWSVTGAGLSFLTPNATSTSVLVDGPAGDYIVKFTATNALNQSVSSSVTVRYAPSK